MKFRSPFHARMYSKKAETATLCGRAEQHDFCSDCGLLLCEGELCGPPTSYEDEDDELDKD